MAEHKLVGGTLTRNEDGIVARCTCGWSSAHFSSMAASAAFQDHQERNDRSTFTTGERGPYTDLTNDIKAVLASLRLPQPDRAKADEGVDLHKVIATAFYEGCKRIWPKRRLPYKASLLSVAYADEVAPAIIRTLSARAEAAEARAETAWAEALEEAARLLEVRGWNGAHNSPIQMIRALRTAPPPTAKEG